MPYTAADSSRNSFLRVRIKNHQHRVLSDGIINCNRNWSRKKARRTEWCRTNFRRQHSECLLKYHLDGTDDIPTKTQDMCYCVRGPVACKKCRTNKYHLVNAVAQSFFNALLWCAVCSNEHLKCVFHYYSMSDFCYWYFVFVIVFNLEITKP